MARSANSCIPPMWSPWTWVATASNGWSCSTSVAQWADAERRVDDDVGVASTNEPDVAPQQRMDVRLGERVTPSPTRFDHEPRVGHRQVEHRPSRRPRPPVRRRRSSVRPADDGPAGIEQRRHEPLGCQGAHGVPAGTRHTDDLGSPSASASWRCTGTTSSSSVTTTAGGHRDLAEPAPRVEAADRPPGLDDLLPVVAGDLVEAPPRAAPPVTPVVPPRQRGVRDPADRHGAGHRARAGGDAEQHPLAHGAGERGARRAQHETVDQLAVSLPDQLGDRSTHRVPDRHEAVDLQLAGQSGDVVGALLEAERLGRSQPPPVAPMIDGDDAGSARRAGRSRRTS